MNGYTFKGLLNLKTYFFSIILGKHFICKKYDILFSF